MAERQPDTGALGLAVRSLDALSSDGNASVCLVLPVALCCAVCMPLLLCITSLKRPCFAVHTDALPSLAKTREITSAVLLVHLASLCVSELAHNYRASASRPGSEGVGEDGDDLGDAEFERAAAAGAPLEGKQGTEEEVEIESEEDGEDEEEVHSGDDGPAASDSGSDRLGQDPSEEELGVSGRDGGGNKAASFARAFAKVRDECSLCYRLLRLLGLSCIEFAGKSET